MSILTSAQFQQFLSAAGQTMSSADISLITELAEARVDSMCKRTFALHWKNETQTIEDFDTRRWQITTEEYPVVLGSLMLTNGSTLIENSDLIIDYDTGVIKLRADDDYFEIGRDAILLLYQAGYAEGEAPRDLQYLIYKVGYTIHSLPGVVYEQEKAGDYSYKTSEETIMNGLDNIAMAILTKYKKVF